MTRELKDNGPATYAVAVLIEARSFTCAAHATCTDVLATSCFPSQHNSALLYFVPLLG